MAAKQGNKRWIKGAIKNKSALKRTLGTGKDGNIPVAKLRKAAKGGTVTARRARLVLTLRKLKKKR